MSNPTDILGKVGQKVGQEIKDIRDNYATKVSLANIGSSIDFSDYATIVSLGGVKTELKASLASYASGSSVFTNLKAQRAEVDELVVKGDTTIVNTQTVEVSDNVIEVNLAADDDITADTGGLAVNRGLIEESSTIDTSLINTFTPVQSTISTEGEVENVVNEFHVNLNPDGALANQIKDLFVGLPLVKFVKAEDATVPSIDFINGQHLWQSGANSKYYRGVIDFGFHATASATPYKHVPEFVKSRNTQQTVFQHGIEDLGNGNQDVWRRIDSMEDYHHSILFFDSSSNKWRREISDVGGDGSASVATHDNFFNLVETVPYEEWDRTKVKYIDIFGNNLLRPFSEESAKADGAELGPDLVKYILRDDNPNAAHGGNTLATPGGVALNGPATVVNSTSTNLPEYIQYGITGQSIDLDSQLENTYSVRAHFTADNKVMAKAIEFDSDDNITVLDSTETQIGTWSNDGTNTSIVASSGYTIVLQQWLSSTPGAVTLRINNTEAITNIAAGTYSVGSVSFTDEPFELGSSFHNFTHANGDAYYWNTTFTNSTYDQTIQVLQSTSDGSGDIRFRVNGSNVGSCNYKGENYTGLSSSGYSNISVTWKDMETHQEIESVTVTYAEPGGVAAQTFVPDTIAYETAKNQYGDVLHTGYAFNMWTAGSSLSVFAAGFGPIVDPVVGGDGFTRTNIGAENSPGGTYNNVVTWQTAGVNGDAELLWDEPKGAWTLHKDGGAAKLYYGNVFPTASDLPSASTYHGMFAHVHDTGRGYFAHGGAWKEVLDLSANQTISGDLDVDAGSAIKVADSSGIKINNIDLGNYASFESALTNLLNPPAPSAVLAVGAGVSASTVEFPTTQAGAVVFADTVTYTKNGVKHVYKKTGSNYATVALNGTNRYFYGNYLLDTGESDAGATDTYGKFGTISHDSRNIPRYFYVSDEGAISNAYLGGSGSGDLSSYGPSVLTIDPFVILFPDEVSPLA